MKRVLTYGTFDLFHYGHVRLLKRAKELGDYLIVALSTEEFNQIKGKKTYHTYDFRKEILESMRYVDLVIPEENWEQKPLDIKSYNVDVVVMGSDWAGSDKFEYLKEYCDVVYLDRTEGISTTKIKKDLKVFDPVVNNNDVDVNQIYNKKPVMPVFSFDEDTSFTPAVAAGTILNGSENN